MSNQSTPLQNSADKARGAADKLQKDAVQTVDKLKEGAEDKVHQVAGWAKDQIDTAQERAKEVQDRAREVLGEAEDRARELLMETRDQLMPVDNWIRMTTREHPFLVVGAAVGVGFLIGSLLSLRTRSSDEN